MSDIWASLLIASAWILLAIGVVYAKDVAQALWATRHSKTKPLPVVNAGWPCDTLPTCESWVGKEINRASTVHYVHIAEAEQIAAQVWAASMPLSEFQRLLDEADLECQRLLGEGDDDDHD